MMFCPNSSNQMNPLNDGLIRLNGWSQVVPICMPWATPTVTPTTTPITTPLNSEVLSVPEINTNVMQFTANIHPMNASIGPSILTSINPINPIPNPIPNPIINSPVIPTLVANPNLSMESDSVLKNPMLCPDPCTSQTATRWELLNNISTGSHSSHKFLKRRNDSSDEEPEELLRTPVKQHISEDKVSAIFNRLYITNNDMFDINDKIECEEFEEESNDSNNDPSKNSSIIFTDELQSVIKNKTITDRMVQNEMDKHSKAVVLWQPISPLLPSIGLKSESTEEVDHNSESECDLNENITTDLDIDFTPNDNYNDSDNDMELCL